LEYRGYDSAGVGYLHNGIKIYKDVGSPGHLDDILPLNIATNVIISHTRWATHGVPSKDNSHPHISMNEKIALVHNGLIDNYIELRNFLFSKGYTFYSQTDTEIIANLLEYYYLEKKDMLKALSKVKDELEGSYALAIINEDYPDTLFLLKKTSPLLIGKGDDFYLIASDASPMVKYTNQFVELDDNDYGFISKTGMKIFNKKDVLVNKKLIVKDAEAYSHDLKGYPHYMLKEIEEIGDVVRRLISTYYRNEQYLFDEELIKDLKESDHIIFLGCGTSYHASLVGGRLFENFNNISTTKYIASEWAFHPTFPGNKPFVVLISQSGETADLIHCLKIIQEKGAKTLLITNTAGSTLSRGATYTLLLQAGVEISVASTKAYAAQVALLSLLSGAIGNNHQIVKDLNDTIPVIEYIKNNFKDKIAKIADKIKDFNNVFYLGRSFDYFLSLEASLKLKEISYIHSEAIPGGELKHGPIALINEGQPVIVFITDPITASSMRNNIEEVKSRGARVFVVSTKELSKGSDSLVVDNYAYYLSGVAVSSIAFYLAYYVSLKKGYNVDKPRNLAKSVTVE
ncbi:MAG: glutamine--fructose-6-phosphate transaminase (isomerizing), partial [Bacilli bacterium]|nr:glutamine--fructose-6-phosphate transaminase (isomerizing) [Bacilli bacterium]